MTAPGIKPLLQTIASGRPLTTDEAAHAVDVLTNEATPAQMGAFLMGLRVRGETVDEITGAARTLRAMMMPVTVAPGAIYIVGTG